MGVFSQTQTLCRTDRGLALQPRLSSIDNLTCRRFSRNFDGRYIGLERTHKLRDADVNAFSNQSLAQVVNVPLPVTICFAWS
jgi:hypothetical protein